MGETFGGIEKILIPMNITGRYWTLLVSQDISQLMITMKKKEKKGLHGLPMWFL